MLPILTQTVVAGPFLWIFKNLVGFVNPFKLFGCLFLFILWAQVGVPFSGQPAVGRFNLFLTGVSFKSQ